MIRFALKNMAVKNAQLLLVEGADHGFKRFEDVIAKPVLRKFVLGT